MYAFKMIKEEFYVDNYGRPDGGLAEEAMANFLASTEDTDCGDFWIAKGDVHNFCLWLDTEDQSIAYANCYWFDEEAQQNGDLCALYTFKITGESKGG